MNQLVNLELAQARWYNRLLGLALEESSDVGEAILAAELAMSVEPLPAAPAAPIKLSLDIHDAAAQQILNRTLAAARKLTDAARADLVAMLRSPAAMVAYSLTDYILKYQHQLASLLSATQLASFLEGVLEVVRKLGPVPLAGLLVSLPPDLTLEDAAILIGALQEVPPLEQEAALAALPPAQRVFAQAALQNIRLTAALPAEPISLSPPSEASPEAVHFPMIEEAIRTLSEKRVVTRATFDRLEEAVRRKAFTVTGVDVPQTLAKIHEAIVENAKEGVDFDTFQEKVLAAVEPGTMLSTPHLETVFRANVSGAFSDGQYATLQHPVIRSGFPYATYSATHDDRVRENHLQLESSGIDHTNVYRLDDPVFQTFRPPWDWGDRCGWTPTSVTMAASKGVTEAQRWLASGIEPSPPAHVPTPPFQPPAAFQRAVASAPVAVQLSMMPLEVSLVGPSSVPAVLRKPIPVNSRRDKPSPVALAADPVSQESFGSEPPGPGWSASGEGRWTKPGTRIAIIGGGPGGLFAAYILRQKVPDAHVTIFESSHRLGGKIRTDAFSDGTPFEAGVAELYEYLGPGGRDPLRQLIEEDLALPTVDMSGGAVVLGEDIFRDLEELEARHGKPTRKAVAAFHARCAELMDLERYANRWQPDNEHPWADKTFRECLFEEIPDDSVARDYICAAVHSDLATEGHTCNGLNGIKNVLMDNAEYMKLYHVKGGIERVVVELVKRLKADVRLNTRVTGVGKAVDASFGMVGDEWHGPQPPGEGWVELKAGPRGGKRWKRGSGGAAAQQAGTPRQKRTIEQIDADRKRTLGLMKRFADARDAAYEEINAAFPSGRPPDPHAKGYDDRKKIALDYKQKVDQLAVQMQAFNDEEEALDEGGAEEQPVAAPAKPPTPTQYANAIMRAPDRETQVKIWQSIPEKMKPAVARGLADTGGLVERLMKSPPAGEATPPSQKAPVFPDTREFAREAQGLADATMTGGFGDNKVFISHVYRNFAKKYPTATLDQFKQALWKANQERLLNLSRADLVEVMNAQDVAESAFEPFQRTSEYTKGPEFHFVLVSPNPNRQRSKPDPEADRRATEEAQRRYAEKEAAYRKSVGLSVENSTSQYRVTFQSDAQTTSQDFDCVIIAVPNHWLPQIGFGAGPLAEAIQSICAHYDLPAHYLRVSLLYRTPWWDQFQIPGDYFMLDVFNGCCCYVESARWRSANGHVLSFLIGGGDALLQCSHNQDDRTIIQALLDRLPAFMREHAGDVVEAQVDRYAGSLNAQPGGYPAPELRGMHQPEPKEHPGIFLIGDYLMDSTVNACLMSANTAVDLLVEHVGAKVTAGSVTPAVKQLEPDGKTL